ncbi:TPA: glycosyltransferase family 2 protein [Photobacterium damselae]
MKFITVFTPAYNRAYCLSRLYESLLLQTNQGFKWLVIDDGSTDNTKELVHFWIEEGKLDISYIYKENGGMHTAHNAAYRNIDTELNICIDSDDYMPKYAIESIYSEWQKVKCDSNVAGMLGLDESIEGELIGTPFKKEYSPTTLIDYYQNQKGLGDKKQVLKTKLTAAYPAYPEYPEERLVPLDTLPTLICRDYYLIPINKVWVTVDYQLDGSSSTIINQYFKSPKGFRYAREVNMKYAEKLSFKFRSAIHFGISSLIMNSPKDVLTSSNPFLTISAFPISYIIYKYLKMKVD